MSGSPTSRQGEAATATAGAPSASASSRVRGRRGADPGSGWSCLGPPEILPGKPGASASGSGRVVLGCAPSAGVIRSERRLWGKPEEFSVTPWIVSFFPYPLLISFFSF